VEIEKALKKGEKFPFSRITYCNIGNPHDLGQPPITWFRQVLSLVENPVSIEDAGYHVSSDARRRAALMKANIGGGTGAYSSSRGLDIVREDVATFIMNRDGRTETSTGGRYAIPENIFLSDGASPSVARVLQLLIRSSVDGIMIPIPQYPLYSATISLLGGSQLQYYLDESKGWALTATELERCYETSVAHGRIPRALVVINPGNPTGQVLPLENMKEIIHFCLSKDVVLLADEVYQENVYFKDIKPFYSFKQVKHMMGPEYSKLELFSFHSVSKGFIGECGKRGGYVEMDGIAQDVMDEYYKLSSINLCPNVLGQLMVSLMVNPPKPGDESFDQFVAERDEVYSSLQRRAKLVVNTLNSLPGVTCNSAEGAMYAFPKIDFPPKALAAAQAKNQPMDAFYCNQLLENTGICSIPGSGFGQAPDTWHVRFTFLPREQHMTDMLQALSKFHISFMQKYDYQAPSL
jgi:alanine transaminase